MPDKYGNTIQDIEQIINAGKNAVLKHKIDKNTLDIMISDARKKEQSFYQKMPLLNGKPIKTTKDLQDLIESFDKQYNLQALLPGRTNGIEEILTKAPYNYSFQSKNKKITQEESDIIRRTLQELYNNGLNYMNKNLIINDRRTAVYLPQIRAYIMETLTAGLAANQNLTIKEKFAFTSSTNNIKNIDELEEMVTLELNPKDLLRASTALRDFSVKPELIQNSNKIQVNPTAIKLYSDDPADKLKILNIGNALKEYLLQIAPKVLTETIETTNETAGKNPMNTLPEVFRQEVNEVISKELPLISLSKYKNALESDIALGRSISGLRGYLGELRALILLDLLFPDASIKPTGLKDKVKLFEGGGLEEAPVDTLVSFLNEMYGIQVKNTIQKSYSWSGSLIAENFYNERLQVAMSEEERKYFGAMSYNRVIDTDKMPRNADYSHYTAYKNIYNKFEDFSPFQETFKSLAFNIIRQTTKIIQGNDVFKDIITNEFFLMQNRIVAASDILTAIGDNAFSKGSNYLTTSFSAEPGSGDVWQWGNPFIIDYEANSIINYSVNLAFEKLVTSSYNLFD